MFHVILFAILCDLFVILFVMIFVILCTILFVILSVVQFFCEMYFAVLCRTVYCIGDRSYDGKSDKDKYDEDQ